MQVCLTYGLNTARLRHRDQHLLPTQPFEKNPSRGWSFLGRLFDASKARVVLAPYSSTVRASGREILRDAGATPAGALHFGSPHAEDHHVWPCGRYSQRHKDAKKMTIESSLTLTSRKPANRANFAKIYLSDTSRNPAKITIRYGAKCDIPNTRLHIIE